MTTDQPSIDVLVERILNLSTLVEHLEEKVDELRQDVAVLRAGQVTHTAAASAPADGVLSRLDRIPGRAQWLIGLITALGVFTPVLTALIDK